MRPSPILELLVHAIDAGLAIAVTVRSATTRFAAAIGRRIAKRLGGDGVQIGFNMLLWTANVQSEHWAVLEDLKRGAGLVRTTRPG